MNTQKNFYFDSYGIEKQIENSDIITMDGRNNKHYVSINYKDMAGGNPIFEMRVVNKGKEYVYNIEAKIGGLFEAKDKSLYLLFLDAILIKGDKKTSPSSTSIEFLFSEFTSK